MESVKPMRVAVRLCALVLGAAGILVCAGWISGIELLVRPSPGSPPMALYTAVALIIVSALLLSTEIKEARWVQNLRKVLALIMIAYCAIAIVETIFQFDLGIEPHSLTRPFNPAFRWPGRMAPSTALCFLLLGAAFLAREGTARERAGTSARIMVWTTLLISGLSLIGFITRIEFLYSWAGITSMALPTAAGLQLAGWAFLASPALDLRRPAAPGQRIVRTTSVLLIMTASIAGLTGFTLSQQEVERSAAGSMALRANAQRQLFASILEHRFERATVGASSIRLIEETATLRHENHAAEDDEVQKLLTRLLDHGFVFAALESEQGTESVAVGQRPGTAQIAVPIRNLPGAQLIWRNGFVLRTRTPLPARQGAARHMLAEQTLPVLTESAMRLNRWGKSGDTVICAADGTGGLQCFPDRVNPSPFHLASTIHGRLLPVTQAIGGDAGQVVALDFRGTRVMADYGPVGDTGLALVLKMDTDELYAPIRHQFAVIVPTLAIVIAGAVWLVRRRVRPLVQQLRDSEEKAHAAQRLAESASAAKTSFLAMMSHEIRTPMNVIMGMTQLANLQSPSPAIAEYLAKIDGSAKNLLGIINDVLDFSKIEAGSMTLEAVSFRWEDVVDALMSMVVGLKRTGVEFHLEADAAIPGYLFGDRMRLQQVLINLLSNAFKFTQSGSVSVRAAIAERQADSILLEVQVADTGIGISPEHQHLLFSPFTQADSSTARRFGGTGLGLAICKRLAEMMGGSIAVDSELGHGTRFTLRVPLAIASAAPVRPKAQDLIASHSERLRGVRVLIAEDQRLNQEVICGILKAFGMEITVVNDGADAVRRAAEAKFDIVLMDIQMPGVDGLEATRMIRKTHDGQALPIIAMTADAFSDVRQQCYVAGMNDHVSKPFELEQLINVIGRWTGRA